MANAGPNTNGSQFFFVWKDTTLPPDYTPFGKVTGGMDVLQKIAAAGDDQQNGPGDGYPNRSPRSSRGSIRRSDRHRGSPTARLRRPDRGSDADRRSHSRCRISSVSR